MEPKESKDNKSLRMRERKNQYLKDAAAGEIHKTVRRVRERELGLGAELAEAARAAFPDQWKAQVDFVIDRMDMLAGIGRHRRMSFRSVKSYRERLKSVDGHMKRLNMRPGDLVSLTARQVERLFIELIAEGLSAKHLANLNTAVRRLCVWLNKPDLCPPLKYFTDDVSRITTSNYASRPKDWGLDTELAEELIKEVGEICVYTACHLRLAGAFGLRVEEALSAKPEEMIRYGSLHILAGTKGGRSRVVPIETDRQRMVLAEALELADSNPHGLIGPSRRRSMKQAKWHLYNVLKEVGLTKADKGLVAHGLRHGYAQECYKALTGTDTPVRGGLVLEKSQDKRVRKELAFRLGHSRTDIVSAYIGTHKGVSRFKSANIKRLIKVLDKDDVLMELAKRADARGVYVCAGHADGQQVEKRDTVTIGVDADQSKVWAVAREISWRVTDLLGCSLTAVAPLEAIGGNVARLELHGLVPVDPSRAAPTVQNSIDAIKALRKPNDPSGPVAGFQ
ncbi:tyrosine-type recombinase/integrase [Hydrogenophaga sp. OTU3427]|uniref:tyrosine-type recombinase/integrase n=1 Tax=Hydrogenophaga sp. OTU3427 TaxID=3043856 RepID=UPI00313E8EB8